MTNPSEGLQRSGDPASWLGKHRYTAEFDAPSKQGEPVYEYTGILRGALLIDQSKLLAAAALQVWDHAEGQYLVEGTGTEHWVQTKDRYIPFCDCEDYLLRLEERGACKHMLAALLLEKHPDVLEAAEQINRRNSIAAAMRKPVEE
jgi:hypothetical protein